MRKSVAFLNTVVAVAERQGSLNGTVRSEEAVAVGNLLRWRNEDDTALFVRETERQNFRLHRPDLTRREVDYRRHLQPDKFIQGIQFGDLRAGALPTDYRPEIDGELVGGFTRFGERFGANDGADANVDSEKLIESDLGRRRG